MVKREYNPMFQVMKEMDLMRVSLDLERKYFYEGNYKLFSNGKEKIQEKG